jgi:hypothetical protein
MSIVETILELDTATFRIARDEEETLYVEVLDERIDALMEGASITFSYKDVKDLVKYVEDVYGV